MGLGWDMPGWAFSSHLWTLACSRCPAGAGLQETRWVWQGESQRVVGCGRGVGGPFLGGQEEPVLGSTSIRPKRNMGLNLWPSHKFKSGK